MVLVTYLFTLTQIPPPNMVFIVRAHARAQLVYIAISIYSHIYIYTRLSIYLHFFYLYLSILYIYIYLFIYLFVLFLQHNLEGLLFSWPWSCLLLLLDLLCLDPLGKRATMVFIRTALDIRQYLTKGFFWTFFIKILEVRHFGSSFEFLLVLDLLVLNLLVSDRKCWWRFL